MRCEYCGRELEHGEEYFNLDGGCVCQDCIDDWMDEHYAVDGRYELDNTIFTAEEMRRILRDDSLVVNEEYPEPEEFYGNEYEPEWKEI